MIRLSKVEPNDAVSLGVTNRDGKGFCADTGVWRATTFWLLALLSVLQESPIKSLI